MARDTDPATSTTLPHITVPPSLPPTPEEIERRRELFKRVMARREEIGPIGISTDELVHAARAELDRDDHPTVQGERAMSGDPNEGVTATLKRLQIPQIPRPTPEELERRKEAVDRILALRDKIGPIGISTSDLIREVRDEADGIDE